MTGVCAGIARDEAISKHGVTTSLSDKELCVFATVVDKSMGVTTSGLGS